MERESSIAGGTYLHLLQRMVPISLENRQKTEHCEVNKETNEHPTTDCPAVFLETVLHFLAGSARSDRSQLAVRSHRSARHLELRMQIGLGQHVAPRIGLDGRRVTRWERLQGGNGTPEKLLPMAVLVHANPRVLAGTGGTAVVVRLRNQHSPHPRRVRPGGYRVRGIHTRQRQLPDLRRRRTRGRRGSYQHGSVVGRGHDGAETGADELACERQQ